MRQKCFCHHLEFPFGQIFYPKRLESLSVSPCLPQIKEAVPISACNLKTVLEIVWKLWCKFQSGYKSLKTFCLFQEKKTCLGTIQLRASRNIRPHGKARRPPKHFHLASPMSLAEHLKGFDCELCPNCVSLSAVCGTGEVTVFTNLYPTHTLHGHFWKSCANNSKCL